ncbi:hypothetical protein ABIA58_002656 [Pseudomonas frederiksbergensis]
MLSKQKKHIWLCLFFLFPKGRFGSILLKKSAFGFSLFYRADP